MLKILLQAHKSNNEVIHKKVRAGKLLKLLLLIFMLSCMTLLSSCFVSPLRHGGPRGNNGDHGNNCITYIG